MMGEKRIGQSNNTFFESKVVQCVVYSSYPKTLFISSSPAPLRITMTMPSQSQTVNEQQTITISCFIDGHPTPTITWTKVGGRVS